MLEVGTVENVRVDTTHVRVTVKVFVTDATVGKFVKAITRWIVKGLPVTAAGSELRT